MKRLFRGGTVVSGDGLKKMDVLVKGEKILAMGEDLEFKDAEIVDVTGKLLFPGFIDPHTHMDLEVSGTVTAEPGLIQEPRQKSQEAPPASSTLPLRIRGKAFPLPFSTGMKRRMARPAVIMRSISPCRTGGKRSARNWKRWQQAEYIRSNYI